MAASSVLLNANIPGLGKTPTALIATLRRNPKAPILIVCPGSLKRVWAVEIERWRPGVKPVVLDGMGSFRWPQSGEAVIVNPEIFPEYISKITIQPGTILIIDELQLFKNPKAARYTRMDQIVNAVLAFAGGAVWGLTGTPVLRHPDDAYYELKLLRLTQKTWHNKAQFDRAWGAKEKVIKRWDPVKGERKRIYAGVTYPEMNPYRAQVIRRVLAPVMIRRQMSEVADQMPPGVRHRWIDVPITAEVKRLADEVVQRITSKGRIPLDEAIETVMRHKGTAEFELYSRLSAAIATAKIPFLLEYVERFEETEEPLVVAAAHVAVVDQFAVRPGWKVITGETSLPRRQQIVEEFQTGGLKGLGITIKAAGVGLTLTRAHNIVVADHEPADAWNEQVVKRLDRLTQTRVVNATHLVAQHAIDHHLCQIILQKRAQTEGVF